MTNSQDSLRKLRMAIIDIISLCYKYAFFYHISPNTNIFCMQINLATIDTATLRKPTTSDTRPAKLIAYYLPQYYPNPDNDHWWGKGFTEWTNVTKAKPLFRSHQQPNLPSDLGFYDLRIRQVREQQASLAKEYGIHAFAYWHYWFSGRRILTAVEDDLLQGGPPDLPYFLFWANGSWEGTWHGLARGKTLIKQEYDLQELRAHYQFLKQFFTDSRYMQINGAYVLGIRVLWNLPPGYLAYLHNMARADGIDLFIICIAYHNEDCNHCNSANLFTHEKIPTFQSHHPLLLFLRRGRPYIAQYSQMDFTPFQTQKKFRPTVIPNWDNTPRSEGHGTVVVGTTPEIFQNKLEDALHFVQQFPEHERIVFLKSWNEWAEGNHLEPNRTHGHQWLEAVRQAQLNVLSRRT